MDDDQSRDKEGKGNKSSEGDSTVSDASVLDCV